MWAQIAYIAQNLQLNHVWDYRRAWFTIISTKHQLNRHEFEQTLGDSEGQGSLAGYSPRGHKELDTTEQLTFLPFGRYIYVLWKYQQTKCIFKSYGFPSYHDSNKVKGCEFPALYITCFQWPIWVNTGCGSSYTASFSAFITTRNCLEPLTKCWLCFYFLLGNSCSKNSNITDKAKISLTICIVPTSRPPSQGNHNYVCA